MCTSYSTLSRFTYLIVLLSLGAGLLGSCNRAQQLGMKDNPQEILNHELNAPEAVLTPNQSITLLNHCAELGEQNAARAAKKTVSIFAGNTGAGKSTTLNALLGCQMKAVKPSELGLPGLKRVVVVDPESPRKEVMPIGHTHRSHTFMPQIVPDPEHTHRAYCDCPGFSNNRGAEINIANAINIKRILQQAAGVKVVFLTEYAGLIGSWRNNVQAMENMCRKMFGSADNLRRHQDSVLLGITKTPLYIYNGPLTKNALRGVLTRTNSDIATILANRIFLFDPLDRATDTPDFWSIQRCRTEIAQLRHIPQQQAKNLFQTTLTDSDKVHLLETVRQLNPKIVNAIKLGDVTELGQHWQLLQRLQVVEHPEVDQLIQGEVVPAINVALQQLGDIETWTKTCDFDQAKAQIVQLIQCIQQLPGAAITINPAALRQRLANYREQHAQRQQAEEEIRRLREETATKQMELE